MANIFLIEDDQYISRVYERAFTFAGHAVDIRYDGEAAWQALSTAEKLPSVILLDLNIPKLNGKELLQKIRQDHRFDGIPVVVLTNSSNLASEKESMDAGATLYLVKIDHEPKQLVEKIETLVRNSQ